MNPNNIFQIRSLLQSAGSVLIVLAPDGDTDAVAAGLSLYLTLTKANKETVIVSPRQIRVEEAYLMGVDKITHDISGSNNLVVSLPYREGAIERVSYNIANNKFNLVIEPRGEKIDFDPKQVEYHYGSGSYDLIFTLGVANLQLLGPLYTAQTSLFSQKPLVNIDKNKDNSHYGRINLISNSSISQLTAFLFKSLKLPLDEDIASNLLTGMSSADGLNLTLDKAKPNTLEAAAFLLRAGGRVLRKNFASAKKNNFQREIKMQKDKKKGAAPDDWLKPKIFTTEKSTASL